MSSMGQGAGRRSRTRLSFHACPRLGRGVQALFILGGQFPQDYRPFEPPLCDHGRGVTGALQKIGGVSETNGLDF